MSDIARLKIIVEGDVQGVGYRAFVKYAARSLKLKGFVKNLPDGTVEILCEGEKDAIAEFKRKIDVRSDSRIFSMNVAVMDERPIDRLPRDAAAFDIDYGEEAKTPFERTNLERLEIGSLIMADFRGSMNSRFDVMEGRYGAISGQMQQIAQEFVKSNEKISDKMDTMAQEFVRSNEKISDKMDISAQEFVKSTDKTSEKMDMLTNELMGSNKNNSRLVEVLAEKLDRLLDKVS